MILLLAKYWKIILDVLLLVGAIVLIFIWNPFNLFGSGLRLQTTANLVSDIKEIGELVTAEYYGEVIASLDEAKLNLLAEDTLNERAEMLYINLKESLYTNYLDAVKNNRRESKKKKESINNVHKSLLFTDTLDVILAFSVNYEIEKNIIEDKLLNTSNTKKRNKIRDEYLGYTLEYILSNERSMNEAEFDQFLNRGFESEISFSQFYYQLTQTEEKKKNSLAMIGRGSVKAGFDFGTLDENRFYYDETRDVLHLFGMEPKILNYDINPWFIPERAIPGFDIVQAGRKVNFDDAVKVKSYCRNKLKTYAMEAGILEQAQTYGAEVLKAFFSLMLEKEVKHVYFHAEINRIYFDQIARDTIIHWTELSLIDSVENEFVRNMDSTNTKSEVLRNVYRRQLKEFVRGLDTLDLLLPDSTKVGFNYFTRLLPTILEGGTISNINYQKIWQYRWEINDSIFAPVDFEKVSYWFVDSSLEENPYKIPAYYNEMLSYLDARPYFKKDTTSFLNKDSLQYLIKVSKPLVESLIQLDSIQLDSVLKSDTTLYLSKPLSAAQKDDIENYQAFLRKNNKEYHNKPWLYKWRDKVASAEEIRKLLEDLKGKVK